MGMWTKGGEDEDEDGDEYIMIDRVYGSLYESTLHQKDGTIYTGKLYSKRRLITSKNAQGEKVNFYSACTSTTDGRWFDNTGLPIEAPAKLEPEKVKTAEEVEEEHRIKTANAKNKKNTYKLRIE